MLATSLLLALTPPAQALDPVINISGGTDDCISVLCDNIVTVVTTGEVASVAGELDGAPVSFTESNAWVHGTATFTAEPGDGAELELIVYGTDSAAIATFTGTYEGGLVTLSSESTKLDLELRALTLYADGTVGVDLAGADASSVASATLVSTATTLVCAATDKSGTCLKWRESKTTDKAEVDLDELGIIWESAALDLDGAPELEVKAYDDRGKKLDKVKLDVGAPWVDEGSGVSVLPLDDDPLTVVGLAGGEHGTFFGDDCSMSVTSAGWTLGDALPEVAEIELEGGETWTVPVNSYQLATAVAIDAVLTEGQEVELNAAPGSYVPTGSSAPTVCPAGYYCPASSKPMPGPAGGDAWVYAGVFRDADDTWYLSTVVLAADADDLHPDLVVTVDGVDTEVVFGDEVSAVFAIEAEQRTDANGLDLLGKVKLQGAANRKGKRETLVKGKIAGRFGVAEDGAVELTGFDKAGDTVSRGDILIGGEPIDIERTGTPPLLLHVDPRTVSKWIDRGLLLAFR